MNRVLSLSSQAALLSFLGATFTGCASEPLQPKTPPSPQPLASVHPKASEDLVAVLRKNVRALDDREQLRVSTATQLLRQVDPYGMELCSAALLEGRLVVAAVPSIRALGTSLAVPVTSDESLLMMMPGAVDQGLSLLLLDEQVTASMPLVIRACNREFVTLQRLLSLGGVDFIGTVAERDRAAEARLQALIHRLIVATDPALQELGRMLERPPVLLDVPATTPARRQLIPRH